MECHESLMARRRKRKAGGTSGKKPAGPNVKLDKSLPSLPPHLLEEAQLMDEETSEYTGTPDPSRMAETPDLNDERPGSSVSNQQADSGKKLFLQPRCTIIAAYTLSPIVALWSNCVIYTSLSILLYNIVATAYTYCCVRGIYKKIDIAFWNSYLLLRTDNILLPSSTYRSSRQSIPRNTDADGGELLIPLAFDPSAEGHSSRGHSQTRQEPSGDYFNQVQSECSHGASRDGREYMQEPTSRTSLENHSPHIAYQEKGWERNDANPADKSPLPISDSSKLAKESSTRSSSDIPISFREAGNFSGPTSPDSSRSKEFSSDSKRHIPMDNVDSAVARSSSELRRLHDYGSMESPRSQPSGLPHLPKRGDSLESKLHQIQRKEVGSSPASSQYGDSPMLRSDTFEQPIQSSALNTSPLESHQYDGAGASTLLRYNSGGDFSMDEELSRIIGGDDTVGQNNESFLRRVSNSVRHGRSYSEKSVRVSKDLKNPRSPSNRSIAGTDVGSPIAGSQSEEISWLRNELRKERLRVSELESAARTAAAVKQVNTELSEKRSTMVVLDAQREIVLRELTVLTDHMEAEKRGGPSGPLDLGKLSNHVLRELAESIQKLKDSYAPQIEELMQKRNDLTEELEAMNTQKEKSFQEFEQLSMKNAQLAELNNQLVHQIQELYKATEGQPRPNGLGISHNKQRSTNSIEVMKPSFNEYQGSVSTAHISEDSEPATATVVPGPQVVSIRKGQPRKFNWKKGGQNVAKGVKGLKGAFMSSEGGQTQEGGGGIPRSQTQDPSRQGFGFFGNQRGKQGGKMSQADSVPVLAEAAPDGMCPLPPFKMISVKANNIQLFSAPNLRLGWNMKRASFQPSSRGVSKKLNCEVCLVARYLVARYTNS